MSPARRPRVAIVGVAMPPARRQDSSTAGATERYLDAQVAFAAKEALEDAGLRPQDVDGICGYGFRHQPFVEPVNLAAMLGISNLAWFSGICSGPAFITAALHAVAAVASGSCHTAIAYRAIAQRFAASQAPKVRYGGDQQFTAPFGHLSGPQWAAYFMRAHMDRFGTKPEHFGALAVAQRHAATLNEGAIFRTPLTMEDYLSSRWISEPLRLLDCDYPVDSVGCIIVTTEERAKGLRHPPVYVESWGYATAPTTGAAAGDFVFLEDYTQNAPHYAGKNLWAKTAYKPRDVQVAGLYDGFTVLTLHWLEGLGLVPLGESGPFVAAGHTRLDGRLPVNPDGGALNVGRRHGVNHVVETVQQLRGASGVRQVPNARVAVSSNGGGAFGGCLLLVRDD